jgi:hypothetical protein
MSDPGGPIGVIASRSGGLAVVAALERRMPHEDVLVTADDGWGSWARRPGHVVQARVRDLATDLAVGGCKLIVLASLQGTLDAAGLRSAPTVPLVAFDLANVVSRAGGSNVSAVVGRGSVRLPQLTGALKQIRSGGLPVVELGDELPPSGGLALLSADACAQLVAVTRLAGPGRPVVSAAEVAAEQAHRALARTGMLARRRRPGRRIVSSSHPAAASSPSALARGR